ncbi:hypothetical protein GDO86_007512 [Hymenochirus boettgeri]|uniref:Uncharacterized protein n=1 Tax=Hymenochirus boettgeri TaxID=247094 RepID=A0A8T2IZA0_9PIPI|nr:hypothetical protein GDO86_007512 [Hymenochirus boettgeri]
MSLICVITCRFVLFWQFAFTFPELVKNLILLDSFGVFPVNLDSMQTHIQQAVTFYSRIDGVNTHKVYSPEGALQR